MLEYTTPLLAAVIGSLALGGCADQRPGSTELSTASAAIPVFDLPERTCAPADLRPSTAAPAEGLWVVIGDAATVRVAALIGPARVRSSDGRLTRRVETVEVRGLRDTLRLATDTAAVRLELLPPLAVSALGDVVDASGDPAPSVPVAVYMVSATTVIAAYEPCDLSSGAPRIRYLRRDAHGAPRTDVILRRASGG